MNILRICCVPGCLEVNLPRHRFPHPEKDLDRFNAWLHVIRNPKLTGLPAKKVFDQQRVCHRHFLKSDKLANDKISKSSIPRLYLPETDRTSSPNEIAQNDDAPSIGEEISSSKPPKSLSTHNIAISRRQLLEYYTDCSSTDISEQFNNLVTKVKMATKNEELTPYSRQLLSKFIYGYKLKWTNAKRNKSIFNKKEASWLNGCLFFPSKFTNIKRAGGRPSKTFSQSGDKSNHRKLIDSTLSNNDQALVTKMKLRNHKKPETAMELNDVSVIEKASTNTKPTHTQYTPDEAFSLIFAANLTKFQYNLIKQGANDHNCNLYPAYETVASSTHPENRSLIEASSESEEEKSSNGSPDSPPMCTIKMEKGFELEPLNTTSSSENATSNNQDSSQSEEEEEEDTMNRSSDTPPGSSQSDEEEEEDTMNRSSDTPPFSIKTERGTELDSIKTTNLSENSTSNDKEQHNGSEEEENSNRITPLTIKIEKDSELDSFDRGVSSQNIISITEQEDSLAPKRKLSSNNNSISNDNLVQVSPKNQRIDELDDDYESFGKLIAFQLRELSHTDARICQEKILSIIKERRLYTLLLNQEKN